MPPETDRYHYHYQALDAFLVSEFDPKELGNKLDDIMSELVRHGSRDDDYREAQEEHHYLLKVLRDIFWWKLPKNYHAHQKR